MTSCECSLASLLSKLPLLQTVNQQQSTKKQTPRSKPATQKENSTTQSATTQQSRKCTRQASKSYTSSDLREPRSQQWINLRRNNQQILKEKQWLPPTRLQLHSLLSFSAPTTPRILPVCRLLSSAVTAERHTSSVQLSYADHPSPTVERRLDPLAAWNRPSLDPLPVDSFLAGSRLLLHRIQHR